MFNTDWAITFTLGLSVCVFFNMFIKDPQKERNQIKLRITYNMFCYITMVSFLLFIHTYLTTTGCKGFPICIKYYVLGINHSYKTHISLKSLGLIFHNVFLFYIRQSSAHLTSVLPSYLCCYYFGITASNPWVIK